MDVVLTVAGSDSCAGAGIQADLKTIAAHGAFGVTAVTAITAQNTQGVRGVSEVTVDLLQQQLESLFEDVPIAAVKTGMLATAEQVRCVARFLRDHPVRHLVVDPVMVATSGDRLQHEDAVTAVRDELLPLCTVATPNRAEFALLTGCRSETPEEITRAARQLRQQTGCGALVVTGGDTTDTQVVDLLFEADKVQSIAGRRIDTPYTHGTGCTFSAALACRLAQGVELHEGVVAAKSYVAQVLQAAVALGPGRGSTDHFAPVRPAIASFVSAPTADASITVGGQH